MIETRIPPFDSLIGQVEPFSGFGAIVQASAHMRQQFNEAAKSTAQKLRKAFDMKLYRPSQIPQEIDSTIATMWNTGWDPSVGQVNLFACDFGLVLAKAILDQAGGELIFRSSEDMSHLSIFWKPKQLEAFPFHKMLKCLLNQHGESAVTFVDGLYERIQNT